VSIAIRAWLLRQADVRFTGKRSYWWGGGFASNTGEPDYSSYGTFFKVK
jgi:hypothetical protein